MANEIWVSLTEAKRHFGELWKRAAYGGEVFVITVRGKPMAVLKGYENSERTGLDADELESNRVHERGRG
jgi:prevent-host-death family protein